ncbi:MAG: 3,4-dihydroxy-2-butanone-4-phosphate synthase [Pseudomonadota bacterium]
MTQLSLDSIEDILTDYRQGRVVILVDDEDRENEGDLLVAAECVTPDHINFMASEGRGLICLTLTEERCNQLDLPLMVSRNSARFATNFTVSIEAAEGVTTGISAQDRAITVRAAVKRNAVPEDVVTPGHIFPIKAQPGGVMTRAGHTEAGVDLARIAGFEPASVICEILKPDGSMARLPDLIEFAREHGLKVGSIADLIRYRMQHDPTVELIARQELKLKQGDFTAHVFKDNVEGGVHLALLSGQIDASKTVPVRVHVHRGLLDVVLRPESPWSWTLETALETIAGCDGGVLIMLAYDESAEELGNRLDMMINPGRRRPADDTDSSYPDSSANLRMLGAGGQILSHLGVTRVLALGRERRAHGLSGFGVQIIDYVSSPAELENWLEESIDV